MLSRPCFLPRAHVVITMCFRLPRRASSSCCTLHHVGEEDSDRYMLPLIVPFALSNSTDIDKVLHSALHLLCICAHVRACT